VGKFISATDKQETLKQHLYDEVIIMNVILKECKLNNINPNLVLYYDLKNNMNLIINPEIIEE
jgi:hypothetical protein